jgi:hypothetical protein
MKYLRNLIKRIISFDAPKPVGRWRIEECNIKLNQKIDLSNEDHCGPCGQYALEKTELNNKNNYSQKSNPLSNITPKSQDH